MQVQKKVAAETVKAELGGLQLKAERIETITFANVDLVYYDFAGQARTEISWTTASKNANVIVSILSVHISFRRRDLGKEKLACHLNFEPCKRRSTFAKRGEETGEIIVENVLSSLYRSNVAFFHFPYKRWLFKFNYWPIAVLNGIVSSGAPVSKVKGARRGGWLGGREHQDTIDCLK